MSWRSDEVGELAKALAKAQAELSDAHEDGKNPHFRSRYATLRAVRATITPVLAKHGLAVVQMPLVANGEVGVATVLMHESGQWVRSELVLPMTKRDPQQAGSAITYARRYSLQAIVNIASDDDDDAEGAMGRGPRAPERKEPAAPVVNAMPLFAAIEQAATADDLANLAANIKAQQGGISPQEYNALRDAWQARKDTLARAQHNGEAS